MTNFPKSLHKLSINKNKLKELDMDGCESCTNVSTLDNPNLHKIFNAPLSKQNFELNKDVHTQLDVSSKKDNKDSKDKTDDLLYSDVKHAVNEYYALKNKYSESQKSVIKNIMTNEAKSRIEKIRQVRNAIFKCINCKKNGGTKFWKDSDNNLRAICGNAITPCNLNVSILSSLTITENEINNDIELVENTKQDIIQVKMDTLFEYIDGEKSIQQFNKNIEIINDEIKNSIINDNKYSYDSIVNNQDKKKDYFQKNARHK
jgi:hypothetical protein